MVQAIGEHRTFGLRHYQVGIQEAKTGVICISKPTKPLKSGREPKREQRTRQRIRAKREPKSVGTVVAITLAEPVGSWQATRQS